MVGFDLLPDVAFVDLIAEAGGLLGCAAGYHLGLLRHGFTPEKIAPAAIRAN